MPREVIVLGGELAVPCVRFGGQPAIRYSGADFPRRGLGP